LRKFLLTHGWPNQFASALTTSVDIFIQKVQAQNTSRQPLDNTAATIVYVVGATIDS